jgi:tetratricopeptide (TPR) repeat protein
MTVRSSPLISTSLVALALLGGAPSVYATDDRARLRWTDSTPDEMLESAAARALAPSSSEPDRLAAIATAYALADRARAGHARATLERIASAPTTSPDLRGDVALLARTLAADEGTPAGAAQDHLLGVVDVQQILGPFRDTGSGLDARDGPERERVVFDPDAHYAWGSYEVAWRDVPPGFSSARGVPLDVFVFPRNESCSWVATRLTVDRRQTLTVSVAATGQLRVIFDGSDVGRDDHVHSMALFDRVATRVNASEGTHLLAAKVCSGALDDAGRVRLRVTSAGGLWPEGVRASAAPSSISKPPARSPDTQPVETSLNRCLETTSRDGDVRLDQAVVRTLAGADDLRSARAPGILASLADGSQDADHLAMAAWISPSGPSRSAWLRVARDSGDRGTREFAQRRLVERHLDAKLADWAMATLKGARIDQADDPEAALLVARVHKALGNAALRLRGLRRLQAVRGPEVPNEVLEELAELAEGIDAEGAARAREELAARGHYDDDLVSALANCRRLDSVRAAAKRALAGGIDNADQAIAIAQTVARLAAHEDALGLFRTVVVLAPNRAAAWTGLAAELAAQPSATTGVAEATVSALRRARELDPGDAGTRAELALLAHATRSASDRPDDEKYLVAPTVFLSRRFVAPTPGPTVPHDSHATPIAPTPRPPDVADRELHWMRAVVMHEDRRVSELVQYAREIVIVPRTEDELYEDLPAEGDLTEILRARVHHADGTTAFAMEEASEGARAHVRWPELVRGDVVEVAFRSWTAGPVGGRRDPPFFRLDYAGAPSTHPLLHNEVIVASPALDGTGEGPALYVGVVSGQAERREEHRDGNRRVIRLLWDAPPSVADEPLAPPLSETVPTVAVSTFGDWKAFRTWYDEAVRGFTEPDAEVVDLAKRLTLGQATREAKVRAIFNFVADDIRYVNYVSGEWWLPNRPQQLLARREGDCDDKAILLITLLKAIGIEAQEVMVQTRLTAQPSVVRAHGAAVPLFDHGIAFLPGPGGGTYLDATSPQSRVGPLPSMDARATALRLDAAAEPVVLPDGSPADHGVDAVWSLRMSSDGSADLAGEEHATGDDAFWMRTYLTEPAGRAQWVENQLVGGWFPTLEIDKNVSFRGDLPRGAAELRWHARSTGLARREGSELVVALSPAQTLASQLAPLVTRTLPVWLPPHIAPRKDSRTLRIVAPTGFEFEPLPEGGEVNGGPFGRARIDIGRDPSDLRSVVVKRTVVFDQSVIPVSDYRRWRSWIQRIDALMHQAVRLAPVGGSR